MPWVAIAAIRLAKRPRHLCLGRAPTKEGIAEHCARGADIALLLTHSSHVNVYVCCLSPVSFLHAFAHELGMLRLERRMPLTAFVF